MTDETDNRALHRRHRTVALWSAAVVLFMVGASFAAVPLYSLLCRVTNFDGTPRRATTPSTVVLDKTISVRFDANVAPGFPWRFEPAQKTMDVRIGDTALAFYRATNLADQPIKGTSTYNVFPEQTAAFFNKLECFCFKEQEIAPGETVEFPVSFFVDPQIVNDKDARGVSHITLSYTFYPVAPPKPGLAERPASRGPAAPGPVQRNGKAG